MHDTAYASNCRAHRPDSTFSDAEEASSRRRPTEKREVPGSNGKGGVPNLGLDLHGNAACSFTACVQYAPRDTFLGDIRNNHAEASLGVGKEAVQAGTSICRRFRARPTVLGSDVSQFGR